MLQVASRSPHGIACGVRLFSALALLAACEGSADQPGADDTGAGDDAIDAGPTADAAADRTADAPEPPLPPAALRRIIPGSARMLGDGPGTCSHGEPAAGNGARWCAFTVAAANDAGNNAELWVIDVTRAAAGEPVPCDGTSKSCKRLTSTLWTDFAFGGPSYPYSDRFDGDTLIFYAGGRTTGTSLEARYEGPVWAWRPDWAEPRKLTSDTGLICYGHPRAAVAHCVDNVAMGGEISFDLRAGALVDGPNSQLPHLARVIPLLAGDLAWHAEFSPAGDQFALSALEPTTLREVLYVSATADLGKKPLRELVYDVSRWRIALDGQAIYYLKEFNYSGTRPAGTLMLSDFPSGDNAAIVQQKVAEMLLLGEGGGIDRGIGFFQDATDAGSTFRILADRGRLDQIVTIASAVQSVALSADGRFTAYLKPEPMTGFEQVNVARNDGKAVCVLNAQPESEAFGVHFLDDGALVLWTEVTEKNEFISEGWLARPDGCTGKTRYTEQLDYMMTAGDRIIIYGHKPDDGLYLALKHARLPLMAGALEGVSVIREGVDTIIPRLQSRRSTDLLLQDVEGDDQGIYLYGPIGH